MTPEERAEKQKRLAKAAHFWHNADFTPYNKAVDDIRAEVETVDAELYNTIQHHERVASFLFAERGDGDELGDEMNELCTDTFVKLACADIANSLLSKSVSQNQSRPVRKTSVIFPRPAGIGRPLMSSRH